MLNNSKVPSYYRVLQLERVPSNGLTMIIYTKKLALTRIKEIKASWEFTFPIYVCVCVCVHYYVSIFFSSIFRDKLTVLFWTHNNPCVLVFSWVSLTKHVPQKYLYYIIWLIVHDLSNLASKRLSLSLMYLKYTAYVLKALWTNCISLRHTWCPFMV